jgi:serine/threonine protein kinase
MDLAEGGSLQQLLDQVEKTQGHKAVLSAEYAHGVMKSVLQTLQRLHKAGWVYLDLKPDNLVSMDQIMSLSDVAVPVVGAAVTSGAANDEVQMLGADPAAYHLVDFSSAVFLGGADQRRQFKAMSTHSSPELYVDALATRGADVWALGMLLLDMRGGAPAVVQHMLDVDQQPVGLLSRDAHASVLQAMRQAAQYAALADREWAFVERCLTFDWQQRPSVSDLLDEDYVVYGPGV